MIRSFPYVLSLLLTLVLFSCSEENGNGGTLQLLSAKAGSITLKLDGTVTEDVLLDRPISLTFSTAINAIPAGAIALEKDGSAVNADIRLNSSNVIGIFPIGLLESNTIYEIQITDQLTGANNESIAPLSIRFQTKLTDLELVSIMVDNQVVTDLNRIQNITVNPQYDFTFSNPVDLATLNQGFDFSGPNSLNFNTTNDNKTVEITFSGSLNYLAKYEIEITDELEGEGGAFFSGYDF